MHETHYPTDRHLLKIQRMALRAHRTALRAHRNAVITRRESPNTQLAGDARQCLIQRKLRDNTAALLKHHTAQCDHYRLHRPGYVSKYNASAHQAPVEREI